MRKEFERRAAVGSSRGNQPPEPAGTITDSGRELNQRRPSKGVKAIPRQRIRLPRNAPPSTWTRMTTAELFLISPIWPSSTLSLKPEIRDGWKFKAAKKPAARRGYREQ